MAAPATPDSTRTPSPWTLAVLAAIFVVVVATTWGRWGSVRVDAGCSLYQAAAIAQGDVLYRDLASPYGPVGAYALAAMFRLFGIHLLTAYATGLALVLAESCLLWTIMRRMLSEAEAAVALAGFWVLQAFQPGPFDWVLPNVTASPCAALAATATVALLVADAEHPRARLLAAASVCAALAGLAKVEHGAAACVTLVAYCFVLRPGRTPAAIARDLATATLPGLLLTAAVAAVFLHYLPWRQLVFDNVYRVRSFAPLAIYKAKVFQPRLAVYRAAALSYLVELPLRAAVVAVGLRWMRAGTARRWAGAALAAVAVALPFAGGTPDNVDLYTALSQSQFGWTPPVWAALALAAVVAPRRMPAALPIVAVLSVALSARWDFRVAWSPYYAMFGPLLAVLVVRAVAGRLGAGDSPSAIAVVMGTWVALGALAGWEWYAAQTYWLAYPRGATRMPPGPGEAMASVIDTLRSSTRPGDWVAVMPEEQIVNFLAETRQPTRDAGIGPGWLATADDVARYLVELESRAPRFVVVSKRRYAELGGGSFLQYHPEIARYLARRYAPVHAVQGFSILERRTSSATAPR